MKRANKILDLLGVDYTDMFEMANILPKDTNLNRVICVSVKGKAKHAPRIKVQNDPGNKIKSNELDISITIENNPQLVKGRLNNKELNKISEWIKINKSTLLKYWNDELDTKTMLTSLIPIK